MGAHTHTYEIHPHKHASAHTHTHTNTHNTHTETTQNQFLHGLTTRMAGAQRSCCWQRPGWSTSLVAPGLDHSVSDHHGSCVRPLKPRLLPGAGHHANRLYISSTCGRNCLAISCRLALNVGVRRPFSTEKSSGCTYTSFT